MPATVIFQGSASVAVPGGTLAIGPFSVIGTIVPVPMSLNLQSGNNTFAVPTGAVGVIVIPPTTNAIVLKSKTVSGDTGIDRPQAAPWLDIFDQLNIPADYYINAASTTTGLTNLLFF